MSFYQELSNLNQAEKPAAVVLQLQQPAAQSNPSTKPKSRLYSLITGGSSLQEVPPISSSMSTAQSSAQLPNNTSPVAVRSTPSTSMSVPSTSSNSAAAGEGLNPTPAYTPLSFKEKVISNNSMVFVTGCCFICPARLLNCCPTLFCYNLSWP